MKHSWLVQRLARPHVDGLLAGKDNPFSFGGGLRNGGLSDDAMDLLRPVFSFDYMGAAEFEFGAVPEALKRLAQAPVLVVSEMIMDLTTVKMPYVGKGDITPSTDGYKTIYTLCPEPWVQEVNERCFRWATDPAHKDAQSKEYIGLNNALLPTNHRDERILGWLELDNGFMFFTDREMCAQSAHVFGIEHPFGEFVLNTGAEDD